MIRRTLERLFAHVDLPLTAGIFALLGYGLVVLYSAFSADLGALLSQAMNIAVALIVFWLASNLPPQHLKRFALPLYALGMLLLLAVALFGDVSHGARRWLDLGVLRLQPSELMKIAVPLILAWHFDRRQSALSWRDFLTSGVLLLLPVAFILRQPDLGTSLLILGSGFFVVFLAGLPIRVLVAMGAAGLAAAPFIWSGLHDYQRRRILTLFQPGDDPLGAGYHTIQSTIALGSGGLFGKGWLNGTQTHLDFLPERHTDFIFAVLSEEFGLMGVILLLSLYAFVIGRGLYMAAKAPTAFGRLLGGSLVLTFATYVVVNIGMVSGILPVVGVPLPLISYGGTAMVTLLMGFGILAGLYSHQQLNKA